MSRSRLLFLGAAAMLAAAPVAAQETHSVRGVVVDSLTGAPVHGAIVRIPALERYTITNEDGWFGFAGLAAGEHVLEVGQLGYGSVTTTVRLPADAPLTLRIAPEPIVLEAIQVHNDRLSREAKRLAHAMWPNTFYKVFDREKILETGAPDGLEFLRRGPRMPIKPCRPREEESPLCTRLAFSGIGFSFRTGPSLRTAALNSYGITSHGIAAVKGLTAPPVFLDDLWLPGGLAALAEIPIADIERVETFGMRGENQIRVYTAGYLEYLATGAKRPVLILPPEHLYEPPDLFFSADTFRIRR